MVDLASIRTASFSLTPTGYSPEEVDQLPGRTGRLRPGRGRPGPPPKRVLLPDPDRVQPGGGR